MAKTKYETPSVDVELTTFNCQQYIKETLNSILSQKTDFRFRIVICDDHSTDGTKEILQEYQQKYPDMIRLNINKQNLGLQKNTNLIKQYLTADFIAPIDNGDVWIDKYKLQKQFDFLLNHPEYSAYYASSKIIDQSGQEILPNDFEKWKVYNRYTFDHSYDFTSKEGILYLLPAQTSSSMYRNFYKNFSQQQLLDYQNIRANDDQKRALLLTLNNQKCFCDSQIFSSYRKTHSSWTVKNVKNNLCVFHYKAILDMERFVKKYYDPLFAMKTAKQNRYLDSQIIFTKEPTFKNYLIMQYLKYRKK